jgi:hypothetical protein
MFCEAQAVTADGGVSTNIIDLGAANKGPLKIYAQVDEAFTAAGAATLAISLRSSPNSDMSGPTVELVTRAYPKADLIVGKEIMELQVPPKCGRYVELLYTVATGPFLTGKITAGIVEDMQTNRTW